MLGLLGGRAILELYDLWQVLSQTLHGTAIYANIDPPNHPNVGIYGIHGVSGYDVVVALQILHLDPTLRVSGAGFCTVTSVATRDVTCEVGWVLVVNCPSDV